MNLHTLICRRTSASVNSERFTVAVDKAETYARYLNQEIAVAGERKGNYYHG